MTRTFAFLLGCVLLTAGSVPVGAAGLSWKVLNPVAKGTEVCLYGSENVVRTDSHVLLWTKCVAKEDLASAVREDATGSLSDIAAAEIAHDYVPPIVKIYPLQGDQIIDAVVHEELANNGTVRPLLTALREIDCAKGRVRDLSVVAPGDGQINSSDVPQDWHRIPQSGDLASLEKLLCESGPPGHSKTHVAHRALGVRVHARRRHE
jgi:hypothetical protein